MLEWRWRIVRWTAALWIMAASATHAARVLSIAVEPKPDAKTHEVHIELLFDLGEAAVELELLALEFNNQVVPPLRPILSNNPSARSATGQYVARSTAAPANRERLQRHTIVVPLDHLRLSAGLHQVAYQVRVLQDRRTVEHVCAPLIFINVGKSARVTGRRRENVVIKEVRPERRTIEIPREIDGKKVTEKQSITVRVPESRQVQREVPVIDSGEYSEAFAAVALPEVEIADPNIAAQVQEMQTVPWTPPRTIHLSFATNRNVVQPAARDASRFGNDVDTLTYGTALVDISVKKTHGERPPSQEPLRPTPQDSFNVSQIAALSEDDFFQAISNALWQTAGNGPTTKNDVVLFVHGYNNSFRFSCVRFAQLVYDTRFEGKPVLFSWPANGGDSLMDEVMGIVGYGSDRTDARKSVDALAHVLREIARDQRKPDNAPAARGDIHLIAHSMGCQLLVDALEKLHPEWTAKERPFKSIIMAAPDVDAADLTRLLQCVRAPARQVTLYFCEGDRALWASSQYHSRERGGELRQRVGQALCVLPEIENIDANKANTTFIGHSYFVDGSLVLRDLEDIVQRDYGPELRVLCPDNKQPEQYAYWKIIDDKTQCESPAAPLLSPAR